MCNGASAPGGAQRRAPQPSRPPPANSRSAARCALGRTGVSGPRIGSALLPLAGGRQQPSCRRGARQRAHGRLAAQRAQVGAREADRRRRQRAQVHVVRQRQACARAAYT